MSAKQDFAEVYDTVIETTGTIADGIFSVDSTNATITQFNNSVVLWPSARLTLDIPDTFAGVPTVDSTIDLFMCIDDMAGGGGDETAPTTTLKQGASHVGSFALYATDENQPKQVVVSLIGITRARFFIQNNSGQTMSYAAGATVKIEGMTLEDV